MSITYISSYLHFMHVNHVIYNDWFPGYLFIGLLNYPVILRILGFQIIIPGDQKNIISPGDPYRSPNIIGSVKISNFSV